MTRGWLALVLTACSGASPKPTVAPPLASAPVPPASAPDRGSVIGKPGARTIRIEAPHGGAIQMLASSQDGKTVVSVDELGGVRLWVALDGSAEPRVIDLPRPADLVVAPHAKGYVLAMTDSVGGLLVQLVDPEGVTRQRATLPIEPAYAGVASAGPHGLLAWRADQRIVLVAPDTGAIVGELPTESGQRIVALGANADKALAILEVENVRKARWVTLAPQLAWGAFVDTADELGANVAISPSGKRIASLVSSPTRGIVALVFDAAGKLVANEPAPTATALALPTDDTVALAAQQSVTWIDLTKVRPRPTPPAPRRPATPGNPVLPPQPITDVPLLGIAAGGRAVGAVNGELVIATPGKIEFLGYELEAPAVAAGGPNGQLLIGLGDAFAVLDDKLVASAPPDLLVPPGSSVADVRWLRDNDWLVQTSRLTDGITAIHLVDTATKRSAVIRKGMAMVHMMAYDLSTSLAAFSLGDSPEVFRHVPGKLDLQSLAILPKPKGFERAELVPVNPALAGGTQLVVVLMRDRLTIRWAQDARKLEAGTPITVDGSLASVDAAGRVYVWQSDPTGALVLAMYRDGKQLGLMPTDGPTALWPDPKGTRVLQVSQRSISLVGVDAVRQWAQPLQGVTEAIWLDDTTLAIVSAAGIARVDATTGEVKAARCGWRFGLSAKPHPISPRVEPVCTQLR